MMPALSKAMTSTSPRFEWTWDKVCVYWPVIYVNYIKGLTVYRNMFKVRK
jgi:hypothetical protein